MVESVVVGLLGSGRGVEELERLTWVCGDEAAGFELLDRDFGVVGEEEDVPV